MKIVGQVFYKIKHIHNMIRFVFREKQYYLTINNKRQITKLKIFTITSSSKKLHILLLQHPGIIIQLKFNN